MEDLDPKDGETQDAQHTPKPPKPSPTPSPTPTKP